ncbi:titin homolog [Palaemon carinicauda]|uniref:titin homolog n=1 Tax=Palaemon carinicauda TaxID=392227 RepID=UPI0035B6630E
MVRGEALKSEADVVLRTTIYHTKKDSKKKKIKQKVGKRLENNGQTCSPSEESTSIAGAAKSLDKDLNKKVNESVNSSSDNKDMIKKELKCKNDKRKTCDGIVDVVCKAPKEKKRKVSIATEPSICKELETESVQLPEDNGLLENANKELKEVGSLENHKNEGKVKLKKKKKAKEIENHCAKERDEESRVSDDEKIPNVTFECKTTVQEGSFEVEAQELKEGQVKLKKKKKLKCKESLDAGQVNESLDSEKNTEVQSPMEAKQICDEIVEGKVKLKKKKKATNKESLDAGQVNESLDSEKNSEVQSPMEAKEICKEVVEGKVKLKKKKKAKNKESLDAGQVNESLELEMGNEVQSPMESKQICEEVVEGKVKLKKKRKKKAKNKESLDAGQVNESLELERSNEVRSPMEVEQMHVEKIVEGKVKLKKKVKRRVGVSEEKEGDESDMRYDKDVNGTSEVGETTLKKCIASAEPPKTDAISEVQLDLTEDKHVNVLGDELKVEKLKKKKTKRKKSLITEMSDEGKVPVEKNTKGDDIAMEGSFTNELKEPQGNWQMGVNSVETKEICEFGDEISKEKVKIKKKKMAKPENIKVVDDEKCLNDVCMPEITNVESAKKSGMLYAGLKAKLESESEKKMDQKLELKKKKNENKKVSLNIERTIESESFPVSQGSDKVDVTPLDVEADQGSEFDKGSKEDRALSRKKRKRKKKTKQQTSTYPEEENEASPLDSEGMNVSGIGKLENVPEAQASIKQSRHSPEISSQTKKDKRESDISAETPVSRKNIKDDLSECEGQVTPVSHSHKKKKNEIKNLAKESGESSERSDKKKKRRRISAVTEGSSVECKSESFENESLLFDDKDAQEENITPSAKKPKIEKDSLLELSESKDIRKKKKFLKKIINLMLNSSDQEIELKENILTTLTDEEDQTHLGKKRRKLSKQEKSLSSAKDEVSLSHEMIPSDYRGWNSSPPQSQSRKGRLRTSSWDFTVTTLNWDKPAPRKASPHLAKKSPKEIVQSTPIQEKKCIATPSQQIETSPKVKAFLAKAEDNDSDLDVIYYKTDAVGDGASTYRDDRDEAYGSPGDIVPCDEVNKMFTDEEIRIYHQKCLEDDLKLRTGNTSKRKNLLCDEEEEASQFSIPEQEDITSDNEEGMKAILETIVRDTGRKSSIEGLKEEFEISSSSSSDVVVISEENGEQEYQTLKEQLEDDAIQEKTVLKDHERVVSSSIQKISDVVGNKELPNSIELKPDVEEQSIGNLSKDALSPGISSKSKLTEKSVSIYDTTSQKDTDCSDIQEIVAGYKISQIESTNETLGINCNDDLFSTELGETPFTMNGFEKSGSPSDCSIDLGTRNASNLDSSKADADEPDVICIENDTSKSTSKINTNVVDAICSSGKPNGDTSRDESLGKSSEIKEPNFDAESLQDVPKHSEPIEAEIGTSNGLLNSQKNSKREGIDTYTETTLQSSKLKELEISVESNLQESLLENIEVKKLNVDKEITLQELPEKSEVIERNLKDSLENGEQKEQDINEEIILEELPKNSELKERDLHADDLQNTSKNIFTPGKDVNGVHSKQGETFSQLNESVDCMYSNANDTHDGTNGSHEKIDLKLSHDAGLDLQNTNKPSSASTSECDVNNLPRVEKHKKDSSIVKEKETGLDTNTDVSMAHKKDSSIVKEKEMGLDTNTDVSMAPPSPNEVRVVPPQNNLESDEYNPKDISASEGNQDSRDKLSESYEDILCNDGDEAYEASSDASEEPTPVSRRKTRSQRKSYPLLLKAGEASDSDFSPLRRSQRSSILKKKQKATSTDSDVAVSETSRTTAGKGFSPSESDDVAQHREGALEFDAGSEKSLSERFPLNKIERKRSRKSYSSSKECEADAMRVKKRKMTKQCISDSEVGNYLVEEGFLDRLRSKGTRQNQLSSNALPRNSPGRKVSVNAASPFKTKGLKVQRSLEAALSEGCPKNEGDASDKVTASLITNKMGIDDSTPQDDMPHSDPCSQLSDGNLKSTLVECDVIGVSQKSSERVENFDDEQVFLENSKEESFSFRELLEEEEGDEIEVLSTSGLADSEDGLELTVSTVIKERTIEKYKTSSKSASVSKKWQRRSSKQSPLGKTTESFTFANKDLDKLEIPQLAAQRVSEAVLTKEILISPDVSDGECELVLPLDSGESETKKSVPSSEGLRDLLEKLPEESKIVISTRGGRRGGIRSPQKVIPEEQDESSLSQKKSKPNKIISPDNVPKYSRKSSDEDSLKQSLRSTPKRNYRKLSLCTPVKRNPVKSPSCNNSSKKNVDHDGESTDAEASETPAKRFTSKRSKLENTPSGKGEESSSTRVTRSKEQGNLSSENVSDSSDKGRSNAKSAFSPKKLRSRVGSKKDDVLSVTPSKKTNGREPKKKVTAESSGSDNNEEKHSECKSSSPKKDNSGLKRTVFKEIDSISEKRDADTVKTGKGATPDKVGNLLDRKETSKAGIERKESVEKKDSSVSEKCLFEVTVGEEMSVSVDKSKSQSEDVIEKLTEPRQSSYKSKRLSLGKRRTRLSCAKEGLANVPEETLKTSDTQKSSPLSETPQEEIQLQDRLSSSSNSDGLGSSSLRRLPQESIPLQVQVSSPSRRGRPLKKISTEHSTPLKDSCPPTSPVKVSSPLPNKTVKEIIVPRALTKLPELQSPEQPVGRRTRRASQMKNDEAKSSGSSS